MDSENLNRDELQLDNEKTYDAAFMDSVIRFQSYIPYLVNEMFGETYPPDSTLS